MKHENKVMLMGNLGGDPEMRYMPDGTAVANFSMATTKRWKDKEGNQKDHTEWHKITCFGPLAEVAGQYLKKGSPVKIEGSLKTRKWQNKDDVTMYTTEVVMNDLNLLGSKNDNVGGSQENHNENSGNNKPRNNSNSNNANNPPPPMEDFDDDIPF